MPFSSLPLELLLYIFQPYAHEANQSWLASVTILCKALKPVVESVLYHQATITSDAGFKTFCRSITTEPSRGVAVRKLALVYHHMESPSVDIAPKSAFLSLVNLTCLKLVMDHPSYLAWAVDAPFRLRSLIVLSWNYQPFFEDVIASQPSLETLTIGFGRDIKYVQASRLDIPCSVRALSASSFDFLALHSRFRFSNLTCLTLRDASHDDIQAFSLLGDTLVSINVSHSIENRCTSASCMWPTSFLRHTRWPKLQYLEVRYKWGRYKDCPELRRLVWDPICPPRCQCGLHSPLDNVRGGRSEPLLSEYATMLFDRAPRVESLFVVRRNSAPWNRRSGWICSDVFVRTSEGSVVETRYEVLYSEDEWTGITDDDMQPANMRPAHFTQLEDYLGELVYP
ncbi:hypothetical protein GY45DRAFT_485991 [Cubamyces sp. BRFM 1775]|nr:hypothetical protein GY45DRAFT_485991 [Cubamyces sp. BRFM 1775]